MQIQNVIIGPIVTEKAMKASENDKYSLLVAKEASKTDIKNALRELFKVNTVSVHTSITKGKSVRVGMKRSEIDKPSLKKAIVKLKKGQKISAFEPGGKEEQTEEKKK